MERSALVRRPYIFDTENTTDVIRVDLGVRPSLRWMPRDRGEMEIIPISVEFSVADLRALAAMLVAAADEAEKAKAT